MTEPQISRDILYVYIIEYTICDVMCLFLREMVEKLPSPHTYLLLGDAYINIQEVSGRCDSFVSYEIFFIPQQLL